MMPKSSTLLLTTASCISIYSIFLYYLKQKTCHNHDRQHDNHDVKNINQSFDSNTNPTPTNTNTSHHSNSNTAIMMKDSYESLIGNTPLIRLPKLSSLLGEEKSIYVKMECFNPGGTGKDRAALYMLRDAEEKGLLPPPLSHHCRHYCNTDNASAVTTEVDSRNYTSKDSNNYQNINNNNNNNSLLEETIQMAIQKSKTGGIVIEGTSGSTGISLATLCTQRGHSIIIVMPDDQSLEKQLILKCLGAILHVVPTAAISNPNHYVNVAKRITNEINHRYCNIGHYLDNDDDDDKRMNKRRVIKAAFMNQFENEANFHAHYTTTGPEIYSDVMSRIDTLAGPMNLHAFCMSSGTGGTISGVGTYLKSQSKTKHCKIILVDPPGSVLYNKVKYNIAYTDEQRERSLRRHRYDTIAEGIGLDRITNNFALGVNHSIIDDAVKISDQEAVDMAHWLLQEEGLFVGCSSAMNVCGAIRISNSMDSGQCVVTIICDGGQRGLTRFWNREFIINWGLKWPADDVMAWKTRVSSYLPVEMMS